MIHSEILRDVGIRQLLAFEGHPGLGDVGHHLVKLGFRPACPQRPPAVLTAAQHGFAGGKIQTALFQPRVVASAGRFLEDRLDLIPIQIWSRIRILCAKGASPKDERYD